MFWSHWSWPARIHAFLGVLALLLIAASVLYPIFGRPRQNDGYGVPCSSNLKVIGLGLLQYSQDYDEKYPLVALSTQDYGWANAIQPYIKSTQIFQCPVEGNSQNSNSAKPSDFKLTGYTDYFFNAQLQKRETSKIGDITRLIMAADGNDGYENTDARYAKTGIPDEWRTDSNSPSFRHLGSANYLFVDGHVKLLKVEQISTNWSATKAYFQPAKP